MSKLKFLAALALLPLLWVVMAIWIVVAVMCETRDDTLALKVLETWCEWIGLEDDHDNVRTKTF